MKFEEAYALGEPVKVTLPDGSSLLVLGFVALREEKLAGFADDGKLDPTPSKSCYHLIRGNIKYAGDKLLVGGHVFEAIAQGDYEAAIAWNSLLGTTDAMIYHDETEYALRGEMLMEIVSRQ